MSDDQTRDTPAGSNTLDYQNPVHAASEPLYRQSRLAEFWDRKSRAEKTAWLVFGCALCGLLSRGFGLDEGWVSVPCLFAVWLGGTWYAIVRVWSGKGSVTARLQMAVAAGTAVFVGSYTLSGNDRNRSEIFDLWRNGWSSVGFRTRVAVLVVGVCMGWFTVVQLLDWGRRRAIAGRSTSAG